MLVSLHIKNIAVIDELTVDLTGGFNVLTGETGAGKSIIIDSINMVLGQRTSKELIRSGQDRAVVEALFTVESPEVDSELSSMGFETEEGSLLIYRELALDGKSICRVNGMMATAGMLKEISKLIVNIHGQHDNQALLNNANHIAFLDKYAKINTQREAFKELYNKSREIRRQIETLKTDEQEKARKIDLLAFQINEIEAARLKAGEEEELLKKRELFSASHQIAAALEHAGAVLYAGDERNFSVHDALSSVAGDLAGVARYDERLSDLHERLNSIAIDLDDIAYQIREYADGFDFNPHELEKTEERLDTIKGLERKYGADIPQILSYCGRIKEELESVIQSDELIEKLSKELEEVTGVLTQRAAEMTKMRKNAAKELEQNIMSQLCELDMARVQFRVEIKPADFSQTGADSVEFLISTNAGEPPKPLSKIASGGEMSRIMLAIKSILADSDNVSTLIFDEIDTGISGRAAVKVAQKLYELSRKKQVVCITHLAQIACMAKTHFLIEKSMTESFTSTKVYRLENDERKRELARITGGAQITETSLKNAGEMLEMANKLKAESV